jgi:hypothetical protein
MLPSRNAELPLAPGIAKMLVGRDTFQISEQIVDRIAVAMVDMASLWDRPESSLPNVPVQPLAAARRILVPRPKPVKAAVKVLGEGIEIDRIGVPVRRLAADFHPLSVKNMCSGVHLTVWPSLNSTATSGAFRRVILGLI